MTEQMINYITEFLLGLRNEDWFLFRTR